MKFETTPAFDADYHRLKNEHQTAFWLVIKETLAPACDAFAANPGTWPTSLRVKFVRNAPVILEMTWSFASPEGRAIFELVTVASELPYRRRDRDDGHACRIGA